MDAETNQKEKTFSELIGVLKKKQAELDGSENLLLLNITVEIERYLSLSYNKLQTETSVSSICRQLNQVIAKLHTREFLTMHQLCSELYSNLTPVFPVLKQRKPRFVLPLKRNSWADNYKTMKQGFPDIPFTLLNQPHNEGKHIWCWSNLGHQIGHNLFHDLPGLREFLQTRMEQVFEKDYPELFDNALAVNAAHPDGFAEVIKQGLKLRPDIRDSFQGNLKDLKLDTPLDPPAADEECTLLIHFLKYHWLHWLENCFADIIGLVLFDAASIVSFVHGYDFFTFEKADYNWDRDINSKQELIEWFFGFNGEYPIYFRFLFLIAALKHIEKTINRTHRFADRLEERFSPIIDILLDLKMIKDPERETYRYQRYVKLKEEPFITINIDLAEGLVRCMVPLFFRWIGDFLNDSDENWLKKLAWDDSRLEQMDSLVYDLLNSEKLPGETSTIQLVTASRFAYELYPRKLYEFNQKVFYKERSKHTGEQPVQELICLDYYFNRERYLNWFLFSTALAELSPLLEDKHPDLQKFLNRMPELYKDEQVYDIIFSWLEELMKENETTLHLKRKIRMFANHYHVFKDLRLLFARMEEELRLQIEKRYFPGEVLETVLEEKYFNQALDLILESNSINPRALSFIHDTLFQFANQDSAKLAKKMFDIMTKEENGTFGQAASYFRLYEAGELFNCNRFAAAVKKWFENLGDTRIVHREARKGKIKGQIMKQYFQNLIEILKARESWGDEYRDCKNKFLKNHLPDEKLKILEELFKLSRLSFTASMDLWITLLKHYKREEDYADTMKKLLGRINKRLSREIQIIPYPKNPFVDEMKKAIREICYITLLWVHFKSVRAVYTLQVGNSRK